MDWPHLYTGQRLWLWHLYEHCKARRFTGFRLFGILIGNWFIGAQRYDKREWR